MCPARLHRPVSLEHQVWTPEQMEKQGQSMGGEGGAGEAQANSQLAAQQPKRPGRARLETYFETIVGRRSQET